MPSIVKMGRVKPAPPPWYESTLLECDLCGCRFMLNKDDFQSPEHFDGEWVNRRERKPDGAWTLAGPCPCCAEPMLLDMHRIILDPISLLPQEDSGDDTR